MATVFGATEAANALLTSSYINLYTKTLILQADQQYSVGPGHVLTLPTVAAKASADIQTAIADGQLQLLNVYSAINEPTVVNGVLYAGTGLVAGAPTVNVAGGGINIVEQTDPDTGAQTNTITLSPSLQNASLGGFSGITESSDGYWELPNGNQFLYPNQEAYSQPPAGPTSAVSFGAVMRRTDTTAGSIGFALYTDGTINDVTFLNGYLIYWEIEGYATVYKVVNGTPTPLPSTVNAPYGVDTNWNNLQVVVTSSIQGQLIFNVYFGGNPILRALDIDQAYLNGTVGFSTAQGSLPVFVQPDSFNFSIGVAAHETSSLGTQAVISADGQFNATLAQPGTTLPQSNTDPAIVWGAAIGSSKNLIPDTGFIWGATFWNFNYAGSMSILNGLGVNGANAIVYTAPSGSPVSSGSLFFQQIVPTPLQANVVYTFSATIDARAVVSGSPSWSLWTSDLSTQLCELSQVAGASALMQYTFTSPATAVSVVALGSTNNCIVESGSTIAWSGEQLEIGPYRTAYQQEIVSDIQQFIPYGIVPQAVQQVISLSPSGDGLLNINTAVPGQPLNYDNNSSSVTNTINNDVNGSTGSFLTNNAVANLQVQSESIATPQVQAIRYSTTTYNVYSDSGQSVPASSGLWWLGGLGPLNSMSTIPDASSIVYQTGINDTSSQIEQIDTMNIAAKSTISVIWRHVPYVGSSVGSTTINFSGSAVGTATSVSASTQISGTSAPQITAQANSSNVDQIFTSTINSTNSTQIGSTTGPVTTNNPFNSTLTSTASGSITNTGASVLVVDAANNSSSLNISAVTTYPPSTNAINYSDTPTLTTNFVTTSQTAPVSNTGTTSVTKTTTIPNDTQNVSNNSVPNITSSILSNTTTNALSASASNASNPTITSGTSSSTGPQIFTDTSANHNSSATITRVQNTQTYHNQLNTGTNSFSQATSITQGSPSSQVVNANNSGYLNGEAQSTATITGGIIYQQVATGLSGSYSNNINILGMGSYQADGNGNTIFVPTANALFGNGALMQLPTSYVDGTYPLVLDYALPSSFLGYDLTWTISLLGTNFQTLYTWEGITGNGSLGSDGASESGVTGYFSFTLAPAYVGDPGAATAGLYSPDDTITLTGTAVAYSYEPSGSYTSNNGPAIYVYRTPANTVVPNSPSTAITININNVAYPSDANGGGAVYMYIADPTNSVVVAEWVGVQPNTTYTYYDPNNTTPGQYWIWYGAYVYQNNNTGTDSYTPNWDGSVGWYELDTLAYNYSTTNSSTINGFITGSAVGPTPSTPVYLTFNSVSLPSDSTGYNYFLVQMYWTNNGGATYNYIGSQNITGAGQTVSVPNNVYGAATWVFNVTSVPVAYGGTPPSSNYTCSANVTGTWYTSVADPITYTYTDNNGAIVSEFTSSTTLSPSTTTPLSLTITGATLPSNANGTSKLVAILYNPAGTAVQSYNITGNQTVLWTGGGSTGQWRWDIYAAIATDTHTNTSVYACTWTSQASWYQTVTTVTTIYTANPGVATAYYTSNDTLAPTSSGVAINFNISAISAPSDANGVSGYNITLTNPAGTIVQTWGAVTATANLIWFNAGAVGGKYTWTVGGIVTTNNKIAASSYSDTLVATLGWWHNVTTNTTIYNANAASPQSYSTGLANPPLGPSSEIAFSPSTVVCPSDAQGASLYTVTLKDPSGNPLAFTYSGGATATSQTFTTPTVFYYFASGAPSGVYTWTVQASCTTNNNGTDTYSCSMSGNISWYQTTTTWPVTPASAVTYSTASNVDGGTTSAPLTLSITSITTPSDANGSSSYHVDLFGPASNTIPIQSWGNITTPQNLSYSSGGSLGTYYFSIYSTVTSTNTGSSSYNTSLVGTMGYYTAIATGSYSAHSGALNTSSTGSTTAAPVSALQQISFTIGSISTSADSNGSSSFTITLTDPTGTIVLTRTGITSTQTITYSNPSAIAGVYIWNYQAVMTNNQSGAGSYPTSMSAIVGWTTKLISYPATTAPSQTYITPVNIAAPTTSGHQLTYAISAISAPSDAHGSTSYTISLQNPSGTTLLSQAGITSIQTLTYFASGAAIGTYTWTVQAILVNNQNGASSYSPSLTATYSYYSSTFVAPTLSQVNAYTATNTVAPSSSATAITVNINSLTLPSSAGGNTSYNLSLYDPSANLLQTWNSVSTGTISYFAAGAVSGQYELVIQPLINPNGTAIATFPVISLGGQLNWYQPVTTTVTSYYAIPGAQTGSNASFLTDPNTVAPISVGTQISLSVATISASANSFGTPFYNIVLKSPGHTQIANWNNVTVGEAIFFYDPTGSAQGGQYQWIVYPTVTPTNTGTSIYTTGLTGSLFWYQSVVQTTYIYTPKDGAAITYRTPSNTTAPNASGSQLQLILSSINTPANSFGTSSLKVALQDPTNAIVATYPASGSSITSATTFSYSSSAATSGSYTWNVWGTCVASVSGGSTTFLDTWSGTQSWYQPDSNIDGVYMLAQDGSTHRLSVSDSDVAFTQLDNVGAQFQISNSSNATLPFQLGISSSGV